MEAYSGSYPASKSHSLLHTVRKTQVKSWKKAPVAPPAPTPIRVYKVDAINFRDLVQQLTGAPEFKPDQEHHQLFQSVAVAPIAATSLVDTPPKQMLSSKDNIAASSTMPSANWHQGAQSEALELNLSSPSYNNWFSVSRMSQGNMTSLETGRVL